MICAKLEQDTGEKRLPVGEQRFELVQRAWEAVNFERDLPAILKALTDVLLPVFPFYGVAIIAPQVIRDRPYVLYVVGTSVEGWNGKNQAAPPPEEELEMLRSRYPDRRMIGYEEAAHDPSQIYSCPDILLKEAWFPHEFKLHRAGIRSYAALPLQNRGQRIGTIVFSRLTPTPFTESQLSILTDVARPIAVAVSNSIAWEEIQSLRDQLQAENVMLRTQLEEVKKYSEIVGDGPAIQRVLEAVDQVAATDATVLITGETGTGKELIARAIHRFSARAAGPLVKVNCAAIPETLLASELFGHERGAFTGAAERRKGRIEMADGGALFLDEIGELSLETQVMLLRVLQEREFERLGGGETIRVNTRIIAATNRNLLEDVRAGRFRSDLYYRLNVFPIQAPSLRERPEDIPLLAAHFAAKHATRFGRAVNRIERRTLRLLESYDWPGNVRELENVIERAVILAQNGSLRVEREFLPQAMNGTGVEERLAVQERDMIVAALRSARGRIAGPAGAAKRLGLPPSTLEFRIRKFGIDKFQFRNSKVDQAS
jgi:transcriptional regulator with GAF, ATPase, and Fis domain